jgi:hypothetical protein
VPALNLDLTIEEGATWSHGFLPKINDATFLVAGWTAKAQVRPSVDSDTVLYEWSTVLGNAAIADGAVTLSVTPTVSSAWTWVRGAYDLEVSNAAGTITYRIAQGKIRVLPEVTR